MQNWAAASLMISWGEKKQNERKLEKMKMAFGFKTIYILI